jgi:hypothetical protein
MTARLLASSSCHWVALPLASFYQGWAHAHYCLGRSPTPGCGAAVRREIVGMVRSARAFSSGSVVMMGAIEVTKLHPRGLESLELPPTARGHIALVEGYLVDGVHRWWSTVHHSYEYNT